MLLILVEDQNKPRITKINNTWKIVQKETERTELWGIEAFKVFQYSVRTAREALALFREP